MFILLWFDAILFSIWCPLLPQVASVFFLGFLIGAGLFGACSDGAWGRKRGLGSNLWFLLWPCGPHLGVTRHVLTFSVHSESFLYSPALCMSTFQWSLSSTSPSSFKCQKIVCIWSEYVWSWNQISSSVTEHNTHSYVAPKIDRDSRIYLSDNKFQSEMGWMRRHLFWTGRTPPHAHI